MTTDAARDERWRQLAAGMRERADQLEEEARAIPRPDIRRHVGFLVAHNLRSGALDLLRAVEEAQG